MFTVSITGTPGTGKTTLGRALGAGGSSVAELNTYLEAERRKGCGWQTWSEEGQTWLVDAAEMVRVVGPDFEKDASGSTAAKPFFLEGLLSYFFPVDLTIVTRCRPDILLARILDRKWRRGKVVENLEAEYTSAIPAELVSNGRTFLEADTTVAAPGKIAAAVSRTVAGLAAILALASKDGPDGPRPAITSPMLEEAIRLSHHVPGTKDNSSDPAGRGEGILRLPGIDWMDGDLPDVSSIPDNK